MKKFLLWAGGFLLLTMVLIGGCVALLAEGVEEAEKAIDEEKSKNVITREQFDSVKNGDDLNATIERLGEPADHQHSEYEDGFGGTTLDDCIYYNDGKELLSAYQLCFENEKLTSKSVN